MDKKKRLQEKFGIAATAAGMSVLTLLGSAYGLSAISDKMDADKVDLTSAEVISQPVVTAAIDELESIPYETIGSFDYTANLEPIADRTTAKVSMDDLQPIADRTAASVSKDDLQPIADRTTTSVSMDDLKPIADRTTASVSMDDLQPIADRTTSRTASTTSEPDAELTLATASSIVLEPEVTTAATTAVDVNKPYDPKTTLNVSSTYNTRGGKHERDKITIINGDGFELSPEVEKKIVDLFKNNKRKMTFFVTNPKTGFNMSYNADDDMAPASSIKAGTCLGVTKMVDRGEVSWDDLVEYKPKHKVGGSGIIQNQKFGKKYTVEELVHLTINISDNTAYYMLLMDVLGRDKYNEMVTDLGVDNQLKGGQTFGVIDAQELNLIWQEIYAYGSATENGAKLLQEFKDAKFSYLKTAGFKDSAHKSGWNGKGYVDSGIIFSDNGDYIITIMTTPSGSMNADSLNFTKAVNYINMGMEEYFDYMTKHQDDSKEFTEEDLIREQETGIIYPNSPNYKPMPAELKALLESIWAKKASASNNAAASEQSATHSTNSNISEQSANPSSPIVADLVDEQSSNSTDVSNTQKSASKLMTATNNQLSATTDLKTKTAEQLTINEEMEPTL